MAGEPGYRVAPWRKDDATIETTLRKLQAVDPRISQFSRQHAATLHDEGAAALDHRLDIIGRDTRKRDEDRDLRLGLKHIDGRLPTRLGQAFARQQLQES